MLSITKRISRKHKKWLKIAVLGTLGSVFLLYMLTISAYLLLKDPSAAQISTTQANSGSTTADSSSISLEKQPRSTQTADLLSLTNQKRAENGRSALTIDERLNNSAQAKCQDMAAKNYWAHVSPDGAEPWTFIWNAGINSYRKLGENLALNIRTTQNVINAWMASPSHRENLLDPVFTHVGFGVCIGQRGSLAVQHFAGL